MRSHTLDAISDLGPVVRLNVMLDDPFIVIDEKPGGNEVGKFLFYQLEFNRAGYGIGSTTS